MMTSSQCEIDDSQAGNGNAKTLGAADVPYLTAAPTFAIMALLTGCLGSTGSDAICSAMHATSPLSGMVSMYLLMCAFHTAPWLKLVLRRRNSAGTRCS